MKLWLDDVRPALPGWEWAKNYNEAVVALDTGAVTDASFDHDLGFLLEGEGSWDYLWIPEVDYSVTERTGYDVIRWVAEKGKWPSNSAAVHSANPVGHQNICATIERYGPYTNRAVLTYLHGEHSLSAVRYSV